MPRNFSKTLQTTTLSTFYLYALSACATAPNVSTLMTGIDTAQISKTSDKTSDKTSGETSLAALRAPTDPICVTFYKNAQGFIAEANKPDPGGNFLKAVGISVLAGVATGGLAGAGINSTVGQIAAQQAVSTAIFQGSDIALKGLSAKNGIEAKIIKAAEEVGCPVNIT